MLEEALSSTLQGETINSTCWGRPNSLCVEHTFSLSEEASVWQRRIWLPGNDQAVITTHTKQPGYFPFLPGRDLYSGQPVMLLAPEKCLKSIPYLRSGHPRRKTWAKISNASYLLRQCSQEKLLMEFRIGRKKKQKGGGTPSGEIPGSARLQKKLWSLNGQSVCHVSMLRTGLCIFLPDSSWVTPGRHKLQAFPATSLANSLHFQLAPVTSVQSFERC